MASQIMNRVFFSGQQTSTAWAIVREAKEIRTSLRNDQKVPVWPDQKSVVNVNTPCVSARIPEGIVSLKHLSNSPCFGALIPEAIYSLMQLPDIQVQMKKLDIPPLTYEWDALLGYKLDHLRELSNLFVNEPLQRKLEYFASQHYMNDDSQSRVENMKDWCQILKRCGISDDWKQNLHCEKILLCFGATKEQNEKAIKTMRRKLEWLSKFVNGYRIQGCLTDVVNLCVCLLKKSGDNNTTEKEEKNEVKMNNEEDIAASILQLKELLSSKQYADNLWIPDTFCHDAEVDDMLCWAILKAINPKLNVIVQLPDKEEIDEEEMLSYGATRLFMDEDSKNLKVIQRTFEHIRNHVISGDHISDGDYIMDLHKSRF